MKIRRVLLIALFGAVALFTLMMRDSGHSSAAVLAQSISPLNDNFADATDIGFDYTESIDISAATVEDGEPFYCNTSNNTIWYRLVANSDAVLQLSLAGSSFYPTSVEIYQGSDFGSFNLVGCNAYWEAPVKFYVNAGQTYYIHLGRMFDDGNGSTLNFSVNQILPPDNDNFVNAKEISGIPYSDSVNLETATVEPGEPDPTCFGYGGNRSTWYVYRPTNDMSVSTSTSTYSYNSFLKVYTGASLDSLTLLGCHTFWDGLLTFNVNAGLVYYFQVSDFSNNGPISFNLTEPPAPYASFYYNSYNGEPSVYDTIYFQNQSYDPANIGISSWNWNFGDGSTSTDQYPSHKYAKDGDYTVTLTVTTPDGRTATTSQVISVRTHDVAITKFTVPTSASAGQTKQIIVGINSKLLVERVRVDIYKSVVGGFEPFGTLTLQVPVLAKQKTTDFLFSYAFTPEDARIGKVVFKAVATLENSRDSFPADNEGVSAAVKVTAKAARSGMPEDTSTTDSVTYTYVAPSADNAGNNNRVFLPVISSQ